MKSPDSGTEKNIGESAGEGKAGEKSEKHFHSSNSRRCKHATIDFRFCRLIARPRNANVIYMARRKGRSKNEGRTKMRQRRLNSREPVFRGSLNDDEENRTFYKLESRRSLRKLRFI